MKNYEGPIASLTKAHTRRSNSFHMRTILMLIHLIFYHGSPSPIYILQTHNSSIYKWSIKFWTQWMMFRNSDSFEVNLHLLACSLGIVLGCNSHVCSDLIKPQKCWQPSSKPQLLWKWFLLRQPKSFLKVVIEELFLSSKFSKSGLIYMSLTLRETNV